MTNLQYQLAVQNGETKSETGHFFKGAPFEIEANGKKLDIEFKMGNAHRVMYHVTQNGSPVLELEHPDYTPDTAPDSLGDKAALFAALVRLEITKAKPYKAYFEEQAKSQTYEIRQKPFLAV